MPDIGLGGLMLDYPHSGSAVYAANLIEHLPQHMPEARFHLFTRSVRPDSPAVTSHRLTSPAARLNRGRGVGARADKLLWETVTLPAAAARRRLDLLHSLYFAAPILSTAPVVVTVHDVIPLVLPGYHRTRQSAVYSRFMTWTARRAACVITVSEHSRRDIMRLLRLPEDRVFVTYEAVNERFTPTKEAGEAQRVSSLYGLPERFVLYLGGAERRKNLEMLVRAWARVVDVMRRHDVKLVILADFPPPDPLYPDVPGLIRALGIEKDVVLVPQVHEVDKPAVYRSALAFAFPSRYEGFGFPPLESMACGTPVLSSNASSLPEVVGSGGLLLDPDDESLWAESLIAIASSDRLRAELREKGVRNAARFSWRRTAEQTAAVYRRVLN